MFHKSLIFAVVILGFFGAHASFAATLLHTFTNPTPATDDNFGLAVSGSTSKVYVGANHDDTGATNAGSAYVYDAATGNLSLTINNPTPATSDRFGVSVSGSDTQLLIGADRESSIATRAGAAYLYDSSTGFIDQTFVSPTPDAHDHFGRHVALDGNKVIVGAHTDDTVGTNAGAAYLFNATDGSVLQTFLSPTPGTNDFFGYGVASSGGKALIGAFQDDTQGADAGAAYLFDETSGNLLHSFFKPVSAANDWFGMSVAFVGDDVLIGSPRSYFHSGNGSAFLFDGSTGSLVQTFTNPSSSTDDKFGFSVAAVGNDKVLIGSYDGDTGAVDAGAAYLFDASTGALLDTFLHTLPTFNDRLGYSVASAGSKVVVGSDSDDTGATDAGIVFVYAPAVPEPSTYAMGALGLLALGFYGWRRKRISVR